MSKQTQNLSYPEQFLIRRGSLESWGKYIEDYKQKHKVDEYIVPSGQLIAVKELKEDKNYRLKLGNGVDDFYTLSYLDTDLEEKLNQEIQDRITSDEELLANDLVILNEAKQYADDLISGALKRVIVEELPTEDIDLNTIYMVLRPESEPNNIYDEYMYIDNEWEKLGSTEINLDDYYTKDEVNNKIINETNKVFNAVFRNGEISNLKSDYPDIKPRDLIVLFSDTKSRVWSYRKDVDPGDGKLYNLYEISSIKIVSSSENPYTYGTGYDIGDIWIKNKTQVFICIDKAGSHAPYDYTWKDLTNTYTKSEIDTLLNSKQDNITVSGHITKSGNNIDTEANKVYPAIYINGVLSKQTSDYPNIKKNDLIVESEIMNNPLTSAKIARVKFDPSTTFEIEILSSIVVIDDVPPLEQYGSSGVYTVDQIVVSKNGNFYRCATAVRDNTNLYTYTWQTYGTDLSNYYTKNEVYNKTEIDTNEPNIFTGEGKPSITKENYPNIKVGDIYIDLYAYSSSNISNRIWICVQVGSTLALFIPSQLNLFIGTTPYANKTAFTNATNRSIIDLGSLFIDKTHGDVYKLSSINNDNLTWTKLATVADLTNYYTKTETDVLVNRRLKKEVVQQLPTQDIDENTIYLVPKTNQEITFNVDTLSEAVLVDTYASFIGISVDDDTYVDDILIYLYDDNNVEISHTNIYTTDYDLIDISKAHTVKFKQPNTSASTTTLTYRLMNSIVRERELADKLGSKQNTITGGNGIDVTSDVVSVDLLNGESVLGFSNGKLKSDLSAYYTKAEIDQMISADLKFEVVQQLPTEDIDTHTIYLVPKATSQTNNVYDEYMYINNAWELIGSTEVDLSNYYTKSEVYNKQESNTYYQTTLTVGNGIDITNDNISVKLTTYNNILGFVNGELWASGTAIANDISFQSTMPYDSTIRQRLLSTYGDYNFQPLIDSTHKLDADLVDDSTSTNKFVTAQEKQGWNDKADDTTISTDTTSTTVSLTLADNHEYRYTQDLTSLTLTMPNGDFIASVVFASGSTPTSMTYDSSIKWSGDDVTSNAFVPVASKTYNIVMWYDGINVNGVVRGV